MPENTTTLSINDVIREAGLSRTTIYEQIKSKRLTARKVGHRTIILREDFLKWLASLPVLGAAA